MLAVGTPQGRMGDCDGPGSSGAASGSSSRAVSIASVAAANVASRSLIRVQASIAVNWKYFFPVPGSGA